MRGPLRPFAPFCLSQGSIPRNHAAGSSRVEAPFVRQRKMGQSRCRHKAALTRRTRRDPLRQLPDGLGGSGAFCFSREFIPVDAPAPPSLAGTRPRDAALCSHAARRGRRCPTGATRDPEQPAGNPSAAGGGRGCGRPVGGGGGGAAVGKGGGGGGGAGVGKGGGGGGAEGGGAEGGGGPARRGPARAGRAGAVKAARRGGRAQSGSACGLRGAAGGPRALCPWGSPAEPSGLCPAAGTCARAVSAVRVPPVPRTFRGRPPLSPRSQRRLGRDGRTNRRTDRGLRRGISPCAGCA